MPHATAIKNDNECIDAYNCKGLILAEEQRLEEALAAFDEALTIDSTSFEALGQKATVLFALKRHAPLLPIAARMIRHYPKNPAGWNLNAMAHHLYGQNKEAEIAVDKSPALEPDYPAALMTKASIIDVIGRKREAQELMNPAAELDPKSQMIQEVKNIMEVSHVSGPNMPTLEEAKKSLTMCWERDSSG